MLAVTLIIDMAWLWHSGLQLIFGDMSAVLILLAVCSAVAFLHRYFVRDDSLFLFGNVINQLIVVGFIAFTLSDIGAVLALPLKDSQLNAIDVHMGFTWLGYVRWVNNHFTISLFFTAAYASYNIQGVWLVALLFLRKQSAYAQRFVIISYITGVACALIATVMPAMGAHIFYTIAPEQFQNVSFYSAWDHSHALAALRAPDNHQIAYPGAGIIMCPSYHAVMAVLLAYISLPFRLLRWVIIPLNITMLLSTPIVGGHYLVDVLAGIALALIAIVIAEKILPRLVPLI